MGCCNLSTPSDSNERKAYLLRAAGLNADAMKRGYNVDYTCPGATHNAEDVKTAKVIPRPETPGVVHMNPQYLKYI